jgi:hypothetical protein
VELNGKQDRREILTYFASSIMSQVRIRFKMKKTKTMFPLKCFHHGVEGETSLAESVLSPPVALNSETFPPQRTKDVIESINEKVLKYSDRFLIQFRLRTQKWMV